MMARSYRFGLTSLLIVVTTAPAFSPATRAATTVPQDYTAVYQVVRNDKDLAKVTIRLSHEGDVWTLHGFTHDMQGLADFLNVKGSQSATGRWQDGRFLPDEYEFSFSLIGYKTDWQAYFDWSSGIVTTSGKAGGAQLSLTGGAVDPFSLSLNIRSYLAENKPLMTVRVVDEDEIDKQVYQAEPDEMVDTALGCMQTTRVRRIRKNSKRTSLVWYANEHGYIPVLMQHSRKNGNDFRLRIISLNVGGQMVQPVASCGINETLGNQKGLTQLPG